MYNPNNGNPYGGGYGNTGNMNTGNKTFNQPSPFTGVNMGGNNYGGMQGSDKDRNVALMK